MLILTRRVGEKIMIGDDVEVIVLGKQGDQIKIGVACTNGFLKRAFGPFHVAQLFVTARHVVEDGATQVAVLESL